MDTLGSGFAYALDPLGRGAVPMEGQGAYNRHAKLQAGGIGLALPLLEEAARKIAIDAAEQAVVIADYGSSQGKNSLAPMRVAIGVLRERLGSDRPILVSHIDLPANDFRALFSVLETDEERYVLDDPNIFSCAPVHSFVQTIVFARTVQA